MRSVLILWALFFITFDSWAQTYNCDIATDGITSSMMNVFLGQTADLTFNVYNRTPTPTPTTPCSYAPNSVEVRLSLPSSGFDFQSIISPIGGNGAYFTWTYNAGTRVLRGINHTSLSLNQGESVTLRVVATVLPGYPQSRGFVLNIVNYFLGPPFSSNDPNNDNDTESLSNRGPALPVELLSFRADHKNCSKVELMWETASENNNDYMEVLRSSDGRKFVSIGKVKGTNGSQKTSYSLTDENELIDGMTYYYRLKQVDFDGQVEFHPMISLGYTCPDEERIMTIYPNPAFDKIWVSLKGIEEREHVKMEITDAMGSLVKTINEASAKTPNEIRLNDLVPGVYNIKVIDQEDALFVKRFIKID